MALSIACLYVLLIPMATARSLPDVDDAARIKRAGGACDSDPCLNGGNCTENGTTSYQCTCAAGYSGTTCNYDDAVDCYVGTPDTYNGTRNVAVSGLPCLTWSSQTGDYPWIVDSYFPLDGNSVVAASNYCRFGNSAIHCITSYGDEACNVTICPVDGGWGDWSSWGDCSGSCGVGTWTRNRTCTNPAPANEGAECVGEATDLHACKGRPCPGHGRRPHGRPHIPPNHHAVSSSSSSSSHSGHFHGRHGHHHVSSSSSASRHGSHGNHHAFSSSSESSQGNHYYF